MLWTLEKLQGHRMTAQINCGFIYKTMNHDYKDKNFELCRNDWFLNDTVIE